MIEDAARDAIKYVRRELPFGARNIEHAHERAQTAIENSRDYMEMHGDGTIQKAIAIAKRFGAGNCNEMAYLTFDYLSKTRPADSVCLVTVEYHMTVCVGLPNQQLNSEFDLSDIPNTAVFCDEWLAGWCKSEQADGEDWVEDDDLSGVYTKARFINLISEEGEDVRQSMVVRRR